MKEAFEKAQELMNTGEIQEIAQTLAKYGLGICIPHMHEKTTGTITLLPAGIVSCETNLKVSFEEAIGLEDEGTIPVAWRWNGTRIEVCASCCGYGE